MYKTWFLVSALGGAAATGGYFAYSYWTAEDIEKARERLEKTKGFKQILDEYEQKQDPKKVSKFLKEQVCTETDVSSKAKEWCDKIKDGDSIKNLVEGLNKVNGRNESYQKTLSRIVVEVPLDGQKIPE